MYIYPVKKVQNTAKIDEKSPFFPLYCFSFNGKESDNEVKGTGNSLDFGARIYDPRLGRWLSVDPLSAKYPALSPYDYVNNNPILFIDPDGKGIFILDPKTGKTYLYVPNETSTRQDVDEFVRTTAETLDFLTCENADVNNLILQFYEDRINHVLIQKTYFADDIFSPNLDAVGDSKTEQFVGTISWDPTRGIKFKDQEGNRGRISAAVALMHEIGHGETVRTEGIKKYLAQKGFPNRDYNNQLEANNIMDVEQPAAEKLGQGIRDNHKGRGFKTSSPKSIISIKEAAKLNKEASKQKKEK